MNFLHVFILSAVEGITEFLPISSTGHLVLASTLLKITETNYVKTFEIVIQLGAIMAVVVLYFRKFLSSFNLIKKLIASFVPTAIIGFTLYPLIKGTLLGNTTITLNALFWGGIALIGIEWFLKRREAKAKMVSDISYRQALAIGVSQSFSVIPGVSRAAATIIGGLLTGLDRETATEYSFLLAVPTMFAASALDIYKSRSVFTSSNIELLIIGTVLSFAFAIFAIRFLLNYVKKHDFTAFGIYRIFLALAFWLFIK